MDIDQRARVDDEMDEEQDDDEDEDEDEEMDDSLDRNPRDRGDALDGNGERRPRRATVTRHNFRGLEPGGPTHQRLGGAEEDIAMDD